MSFSPSDRSSYLDITTYFRLRSNGRSFIVRPDFTKYIRNNYQEETKERLTIIFFFFLGENENHIRCFVHSRSYSFMSN